MKFHFDTRSRRAKPSMIGLSNPACLAHVFQHEREVNVNNSIVCCMIFTLADSIYTLFLPILTCILKPWLSYILKVYNR